MEVQLSKKQFSINFTKANTNFCLKFHYNVGKRYLLVNGKEIIKFQADNKNVNFPTRYFLGSISDGFSIMMSLEKYLCMEMWIMFQLITVPLINLIY